MAKKNKNIISSNITLILFILGIIIGSVGTSMSIEKVEMIHEGDSHETHDHTMGHEKLEVNPTNPPSVNIEVSEDAKAGWLLKINTENFEFTPENANTEHIEGQGHAHLYINDEKITRLYSNYYYLGDLEVGSHKITVTLNSNTHSDLTLNGEMIEDSVIINQN